MSKVFHKEQEPSICAFPSRSLRGAREEVRAQLNNVKKGAPGGIPWQVLLSAFCLSFLSPLVWGAHGEGQ